MWIRITLYEGCFKSKASYYIVLAHNIRGGQNGIWQGSADEAKVCHWIPLCRKSGTVIHWHLLRPNSECEHSEEMGGAFQQ